MEKNKKGTKKQTYLEKRLPKNVIIVDLVKLQMC